MFKSKESSQSEFEFVSIDELVPDDHLLRLIDKYVDFSFLLEKVRPFYSDDNGRPSDPLINTNLIRKNVKAAHFYPNAHVQKIRSK
ncbi:hypothetical protein M3234_20020 [Neobacillus niacini]|nr:hypothetical protein [Neobacillus niacini]